MNDLTFRQADEDEDRAKVTVHGKDAKGGGRDDGKDETIVYELVREGDGWRIDVARAIGMAK